MLCEKKLRKVNIFGTFSKTIKNKFIGYWKGWNIGLAPLTHVMDLIPIESLLKCMHK